jgi:hypothetical protein
MKLQAFEHASLSCLCSPSREASDGLLQRARVSRPQGCTGGYIVLVVWIVAALIGVVLIDVSEYSRGTTEARPNVPAWMVRTAAPFVAFTLLLLFAIALYFPWR